MPRFEPASCPKLQGAEALAEASCGYLVVPEDRSWPSGRTIRLMVAKYPAHSSVSGPIPLSIWLVGRATSRPWTSTGLSLPVSSATGTYWWRANAAPCSRSRRLPARPSTSSPGASRPSIHPVERARPFGGDGSLPPRTAATGADLSAYNSTENAADFADLRKVLGITTWNVYGTSYGSYLAQTLMRGHPEGIRSVVLDPGLTDDLHHPRKLVDQTHAGFDNLFRACAAETACNAAHPHLEKPSPDWSINSRPSR